MTTQETDQEWIEKKVRENPGFSTEMVTSWLNESIDELKKIGLDKGFGGEDTPEFLKMARMGASTRIQANVSVEPTEFQMMVLGPYPERFINKKPFVEMVGFTSMDDKDPEIASISAWGDFVPIKNDVEPLGSYKTGISFFQDDRIIEPGTFKLTVQNATEFSNETKSEFMGASYDDKLARLRNGIPAVSLDVAENNLSHIKVNPKTGKSYPNPLDIKKLNVIVVGTDEGVDKNGRGWAMFQVTDDTFRPTVKVKFIAVWVDPLIFNRLQAGDGSYLEIYGTIQKKENDDVPSVSACFIHSILTKPLERKSEQIKTDQPAGATQVPSEPQINVMASGGM